MKNIKWKSIILLVISTITVVVFVVLFGFGYYQKYGKGWPRVTPAPTSLSKIINVKGDQLPENLPKDIVFEKEVEILQNYSTNPFPYNKELTLYQIQSSFSFVSKKGPDENFALYQKYLQANDWQTVNSRNDKDSKQLVAIKGQDKISISIKTNPSTKETIISLFNIHIGTYASLNKNSSNPTNPTK